ncbi:hypothetical protein [Streptomyces sp. NPDC051079]|uniref:hypothetical protein n=1 Tax=Streptomyces sp. NPDC051079 TaxID=3155043 RepID=UPI0034506904
MAAHRSRNVPPRVTKESDERVFTPLSGRYLIARLVSLHTVTSTTRPAAATWNLPPPPTSGSSSA